MRVLVTGGHKKYMGRKEIYSVLNNYNATCGIELLIEGGAPGTDRICEDWAKDHEVPWVRVEADWDDIDVPGAVIRYTKYKGKDKPYNAAAGGIRNQKMLDEYDPEVCLFFPGENGTADMMEKARRYGCDMQDAKDWTNGEIATRPDPRTAKRSVRRIRRRFRLNK